MKRRSLITLPLFFVAFTVFAQQDTAWTISGLASLNFSQVSLTKWAAGGQNSIAGTALFKLDADYAKKLVSWENDLELGYGLSKNEGEQAIKSVDKIDFASKFGIEQTEKLLYTALLSFKTQFAEGYNYPEKDNIISDFMAPAYLNLSLGMDYQPNDNWSIYLAPISGKLTVVNNDSLSAAGAFGVEPGENTFFEAGALSKIAFQKDEIVKNVSLESALELFTAYTNNPGNVDVNWKTLINMKINEFLSANISTELIYDDDIDYVNEDGENEGPQVQFKQLLGVGLSYKF